MFAIHLSPDFRNAYKESVQRSQTQAKFLCYLAKCSAFGAARDDDGGDFRRNFFPSSLRPPSLGALFDWRNTHTKSCGANPTQWHRTRAIKDVI
jgi:hypothetical protein